MLLHHTYQVSKYNPAERDEHGRYVGMESPRSDHGPVQAAYLASVAAFAQESGVTSLAVREPGLVVVNFGLEPTIDGYGLAGLFPPDLTGFHDGALVPIKVGLSLVRAMLRDNGAFCRLEVEDRFFIHVGFVQYVYVGSSVPCERSVALAHDRGLFVEPIGTSPQAAEFSDDTTGTRQPADAAWWARLASLITERGAVMLDEGYVLNALAGTGSPPRMSTLSRRGSRRARGYWWIPTAVLPAGSSTSPATPTYPPFWPGPVPPWLFLTY